MFYQEISHYTPNTLIKEPLICSRPLSCDLDDLGDRWNPSQLMSDAEGDYDS